jgi:hypothetical protein
MTPLWVRDRSPGARAVKVPCLVCGRMVRLADALIDAHGPAFKAYYHEDCAPPEATKQARCSCNNPTRLDCQEYHNG